MQKTLRFLAGICVTLIAHTQMRGEATPTASTVRTLAPAELKQVRFTDNFWAPRLEVNRAVTLPHNWKMCEETGRIRNFAKAAGQEQGQFEGIYFNDSDVFKMMEGAAYALASRPDPALDKKLDELIATIAAAQQPDGYLYTFYTVNKTPEKRFTNLKDNHELYCAGHLIEAAVAHHQATGKTNFLDVAVKYANLIDNTFGPNKRRDVCGHEEIELALFKLADETQQQQYRKLAEFFVNERGNSTSGRNLYGDYYQDSRLVVDSTEVIGHAVRQMYLVCAATDLTSRSNNTSYVAALDRLWDDLTSRKMYVTGGIGAKHEGEAFGEAFDLPNESAYAETCAGIGAMLWNHRMNLLHGQAKHFDVLERTLYNGFLSGVSLSGDTFFYVNPLASAGKHHRTPWFDCACCPPNVLRFMANLPSMAYATSGDTVFVNLYASNEATVALTSGTKIKLQQQTNYPWDGHVKLTIATPGEYSIALRVPSWCDDAKVTVNQESAGTIVDGYSVIDRAWQQGDVVELALAMPVRRVKADPRVKANEGRVALQRGPVVYCAEGIDNGGKALSLKLLPTDQVDVVSQTKTLGGATLLKSSSGITFVPYFAWDNREPGEMVVWIPEQ